MVPSDPEVTLAPMVRREREESPAMRCPEPEDRKATPAGPGTRETRGLLGWTGARDGREPSACGVLKGGLEGMERRVRREKWESRTTDLKETRGG